MTTVKYSGFFESYSGMGEAARNIVGALATTDLTLITDPIANIPSRTSLGTNYDLCKNLPHEGSADVKILHVTPDMLTKYLDPMTTHVFHLFWETDGLTEWWVWSLNFCDEIWTGSTWNQEAFLRSGVKKPTWVCPQPVQPIDAEHIAPFVITNKPKTVKYMFYSIFQWIERKDAKTLITTFWKTFAGRDDVALIIKTYKERFTTQEKQEIVNMISRWKAEMNLPKFPPLGLYMDEFSHEDCLRFHQTGDCFVSAHHGEGWGVCQAEAFAMGKPVISTSLGGIHDHVPHELWYPVSYTWENVHDMAFVPWYDETQKWGKADPDSLAHQMYEVTEHPEETKERAARARVFVQEQLSPAVVGAKMKDRIEYLKRK